jgi:nitrate reductase gamma subunit
MSLLVFYYIAIGVFVLGNACRLVRIARMPAHLRWELYPMPRGTAEQRRHGGSYFEETDWWKKPRSSSFLSELSYMLSEVLMFVTVRKRNRPLWLWSWMMHVGLYALIITTALTGVAAVTGATWPLTIDVVALISSGVGLAGVAGLLVRRLQRLRECTSRSDLFNLFLIGCMFASQALAHLSGHGTHELVTFTRTILRADSASTIGWAATVHLAIVAAFIAYFPATHMTHAYMKFFTYHRVRWDDSAMAHNSRIGDAMRANFGRPIAWSAPHIANAEKSIWADAVAGRRS